MTEPSRPSRLWPILTSLSGVAVLATNVAFTQLPAVLAQGACAVPDAMVRFEFADRSAALDLLFGEPQSACRTLLIAAMDAMNVLDVWAYIPAYTAFAIFSALFLSRGRIVLPVVLAVAFACVACIADYVETLHLMAYTPALAPPPVALKLSSAAAWTKFAALGFNGLALGWIAAQRPTALRLTIGVLLCLPVLGVAAVGWQFEWLPAMTLAFALAWTSVLVLAITAVLRARD